MKVKYIIPIIAITYLLIIAVLNYMRGQNLDKNGTFVIAKIVDVQAGAYVNNNITFNYVINGQEKTGYFNYSLLLDDYSPKIGEKYLCKYLQDEYSTSYLFLDIKLPELLTIYHSPQGYIKGDTSIYFLNL